MIRGLIIFSIFLAACASERKPASFNKIGEGEKDSDSSPCAGSYSPIPLLRRGAASLADPDLIPAGRYFLIGSEIYLKAEWEEETFQAHFLEEQRLGGISQRKICSSPLAGGAFVEAPFPGMREFSRLPQAKPEDPVVRAFTPGSYLLQAEEKRVTLSKLPSGAAQAGGFGPVLAQWRDWRIYQLSATSFEIRAHISDVSSGARLTKQMVLRFSSEQ